LKQRSEVEDKEFLTGFWMPDMGQEENLRKLKEWNGNWSSMGTLVFIRLTRDGVKQKSIFPPKGLS
jgi:translation machinery-associated protein 16